MAGRPEFLSVLRRVGFSLSNGNFPSLNFKPLQVKCFESILQGQDVIGVLPTGFGKSMLFHLLPHFIPVKKTKNIVIVVCPLNSIIEDQLKVLKARGITADVLQLAVNMNMYKNNYSFQSRWIVALGIFTSPLSRLRKYFATIHLDFGE